ncbi:hypothetical protein Afil01_59800 [Actinorhabdospora filicis]|uniref:Uncharacterized protein n=1 Tax=Actinorhabdospora filicis TaxID=1785913 RepID=A0A9W6WCK4_9ACTN|nr:DUF6228 family protein [Actinorhabdospora filicis]GLZ81173.1 hypothetical protein Afil01_59800 [Actinorhabdospora filicis]
MDEVRIGNAIRFSGQPAADFLIRIETDGLSVRTPCVPTPTLAAFVQGLADDFRGWPGERAWRDGTLAVTAVHRSPGRVELTWTVEDGHYDDLEWSVTAHTTHDAGEAMLSLARDLRAFFAR